MKRVRLSQLSAVRLIMLAVLAPTASAAFGQADTAGSISVVVSDASHALLPNTHLSLTNKTTAEQRQAETLSTGAYSFDSLPIGTYRLTVTHDGFETAAFDDVVVQTGHSTSLNTILRVGNVTNTVEVKGSAVPVLETQSNTLSTTINLEQVNNLPIIGRDLTQLALLVPGYSGTGASSVDGTFNGMSQSTVQSNLNGVDATSSRFKSGRFGSSAVSPRVEGIQEFTVQTGELDPSQGAGQSASQIIFVTSNGTNKFHGRVYEDHQNAALNANSWGNNAIGQHRSKLIINDFGGNIGGPILHDRLFFFGSYGQRIQPGGQTVSATVPTALAASGIYSYYTACAAATCPIATINVLQTEGAAGFPTQINPVIAAQLAANAATYKYGTLSSTSADLNHQTLSWQLPGRLATYFPSARLDYDVTHSNRIDLSFTYQFNRNTGQYQSLFPGPDYAFQTSGNQFRSYVASVGDTHTFTPNLLNQFRGGYLYTASSYSPEFIGDDVSTQSVQYWSFGLTSGVTAQLAQTSFYPYLTASDSVSWQKGKHNFKFGGDLFRQQDHYWNPPQGYTNYDLGTSYNDPAVTSLNNSVPQSGALAAANVSAAQGDVQGLYGTLTGRVTYAAGSRPYSQAAGGYIPFGAFNLNEVTWGGGFYATDSWRLTSSLTANYGLRWDMIGNTQDRNSAYTGPSISALWGPSGVGNLFRPGVLTGDQNPAYTARSQAYNTSWVNPEPQVGIAYNPVGSDSWIGKLLGDRKSVIRSSFTLKNYTEGGQNFWQYASNYGFNFYQNFYLYPDTSGIAGTYQPGSLTLGGAQPAFGLAPTSFQRAVPESSLTFAYEPGEAMNPNIRQPYVESWSMGFQRQLTPASAIEVRYVGNHSVHSWISEDLNQVNIQENGFATEFKNAQFNLAQNTAAGDPGDFENHGGGRPIPMITQALGGPGAPDFTNGQFVTYLQHGQAGTLASTIAQSPAYFCNLVSASFAPCAGITSNTSSIYPSNVLQANPYLAGQEARYLDSSGTANYNSLQVEYREQTSHGLTLNLNYTYSKTLGISVQRGISNASNFYDLHNRGLNYMPSAFDIRNVFHANGTYALPFGRHRALLSQHVWEDAVAGGWTVGAIVVYQSGTPSFLTGGYSTVNNSADSGVDFGPGFSASTLQHAVHVTRGNASNPYKNFLPDSYRSSASANYAAVSPHQTAGSFGYLSYLYGPRWINTDLAITKVIPIYEQLKLNFQGEFLNAFNHPAFTIGDTGVQDATFGTTSATANGPRHIELRANITF